MENANKEKRKTREGEGRRDRKCRERREIKEEIIIKKKVGQNS